ncbi:MAG: AAA family ATPase [Gemmataceae bacterium]|nr:AAA family ATPase [Gemmataceae bacterium]
MARPPFEIHGFIGNRKALTPILRIQDGAISRGEPLPHCLVVGPSGIGKSALLEALSKRAKGNLRKIIGKTTVEEIVNSLRSLLPGDFLLLDEAHNLSNEHQELLFEVIDRSEIPVKCLPPAERDKPIPIAPCTLAFATDQPGRLRNALRKRLELCIRMSDYTLREMKEIVSRIADDLNVLLSPQAARQVAQICSGLPRRAKHYINSLRLYFSHSEQSQITLPQVEEFLRARTIESDGLTETEIDYLRFLHGEGKASIESLAYVLGVDAAYVSGEIEQPLRYRGLIRIGSGGRSLTTAGVERAIEIIRAPFADEENEADPGSVTERSPTIINTPNEATQSPDLETSHA